MSIPGIAHWSCRENNLASPSYWRCWWRRLHIHSLVILRKLNRASWGRLTCTCFRPMWITVVGQGLHESKSNISHGHWTAQAFVSKPWCQRTLFKLPCIAVSCTRKLVAWHNIVSTYNHREQDATGIWTVSCPSCKLRSLHCHAKSSSRYTDIQMDSEFASRICLFNHQHGELHCSSGCSSG